MVQLTRRSQLTGNTSTMEIPTTMKRINAYYKSGELIQNALPELNDDEREFVMTGITPKEWADTFPRGDDE